MRINVYAEELTTETQLVEKPVSDDKFGDRVFYGVRVFLDSPDSLHSDPMDDDRSAITLWVPWTAKDGHNREVVRQALLGLLLQLEDVPEGHGS